MFTVNVKCKCKCKVNIKNYSAMTQSYLDRSLFPCARPILFGLGSSFPRWKSVLALV